MQTPQILQINMHALSCVHKNCKRQNKEIDAQIDTAASYRIRR